MISLPAPVSLATMVPLVVKKSKSATLHWRSSWPFVSNTRGVLIHRPKSVTQYTISSRWKPHMCVHYLCGAAATGGKNFEFRQDIEEGMLLCQRCEKIAINDRLPSAEKICGRHVHVGKVIARQACCVLEAA